MYEKKATRKLTMDQVMQIREMYGQGQTQGALSRYFGVSIGQIGRIVRGESWQSNAEHRMPTQAEMDASAARTWELQQRILEEKRREVRMAVNPMEEILEEEKKEEESEMMKRAKMFGARV